jgi:hypothetical protein
MSSSAGSSVLPTSYNDTTLHVTVRHPHVNRRQSIQQGLGILRQVQHVHKGDEAESKLTIETEELPSDQVAADVDLSSNSSHSQRLSAKQDVFDIAMSTAIVAIDTIVIKPMWSNSSHSLSSDKESKNEEEKSHSSHVLSSETESSNAFLSANNSISIVRVGCEKISIDLSEESGNESSSESDEDYRFFDLHHKHHIQSSLCEQEDEDEEEDYSSINME